MLPAAAGMEGYSPEAISVQLAYIISAYKLPDLLVRLVNRLHSQNASFFIHVDKKTPRHVFDRMKHGLTDFDNVFFLQRHKCYHGDFGHVRASLKGIREIVSQDAPFDYVILLTGQDYPLKTNAEIEAFFTKNQDTSFVEHFPLPFSGWGEDGGMERIERRHYRLMGQNVGFPVGAKTGRFLPIKKLLNVPFSVRPEFPAGLKPYGGSSYWNLSREAISYVSDYVNHNPGFVRFFSRTWVSDEIFFQTLLLNSPLRDKIVDDSLRYVEWHRPGKKPDILGKDDFNALRSSSKLFARKFDPGVDGDILDMIDKHLLRR